MYGTRRWGIGYDKDVYSPINADLSKCKDSMRPLIERDIAETEKILINSSL